MSADTVPCAEYLARFAVAIVREVGQAADMLSGMPKSWKYFSPTEERVLSLLLRMRQALSRDEIAQKLEESVDGRLKNVLANLVARHALLVTHNGYQLNVNTEADRDTLRELLANAEPWEMPQSSKGAKAERRPIEESDDEEETDIAARILEARRAKAASLNGHAH